MGMQNATLWGFRLSQEQEPEKMALAPCSRRRLSSQVAQQQSGII